MADKRQRETHGPKAKPGQSCPGEPFDPAQLPDEPDSAGPQSGAPRPSPGPNVPISADEYERLKEGAKHKRLPHSPHAQEDRLGKK